MKCMGLLRALEAMRMCLHATQTSSYKRKGLWVACRKLESMVQPLVSRTACLPSLNAAELQSSLLKKASPEAYMEVQLQQARAFKEEGNRYYKEGRFRDAVSRYHWALLQVKGLDPSIPSPLQAFGAERASMTSAQEILLFSIQSDCYNNLAACLLQMQHVNYERVKEYSLKVLEKQPENVKGLYRAGVAFYHLQDYDRARQYLLAAMSKQPKDANVKRYLQLTESQLSSYHEKEKQVYMGMFGKR
ncbi:tetratricopeptide repeat protein 9C [Anolis sagrei]|uniref:tetratricopeptide repeat protein 9C n=1 Tax=Anolis sagrei TaxID=38937 RepID=UPI003520597E